MRRTLSPLFFSLLLLLSARGLRAQAPPWPAPARDPQHSSRAAAALPAALPEIAWTLRTGDFAVRRAPLDAPTALLEPGPNGLFALTADGKAKWAATLSDPTDAVTAPDGTVYVCEVKDSGIGGSALVALTPEGREKWRLPITGTASTPVLGADGTVYLTNARNDAPSQSEAYLYAVNPDGTVRWTYAPGSSSNRCPRVLSNGDVIFKNGDLELIDVDPEGNLRWGFFYTTASLGCPEVGPDDHIVMPSPNLPGLVVLDRDGKEVWEKKTPVGIEDAVIDGAGKVYGAGFDGTLYIYDSAGNPVASPASGDPFLLDLAVGDYSPCPPDADCAVQQVVYAISDTGTLFAFSGGGDLLLKREFPGGDAHPFSMQGNRPLNVSSGIVTINAMRQNPYLLKAVSSRGIDLWTWDPGQTVAGLAVDGKGRAYAAADSLYALDGNGAVRWRFRDAARGYSAPILLDDGTLVTRGGDTLYALDPEDGSVKWKALRPAANFTPTTPLPASPFANAQPSGGFTGSSGEKVVVMNDDGTVRWAYTPAVVAPSVFTRISSPALGKDGSLIAAIDYIDLSTRPCTGGGPTACDVPPPQIVALDRAGAVVWSFTDSPPSGLFGEPSVGEDGTVFVLGGETLYALSPDGKKLWTQTGFSQDTFRSYAGGDYPGFLAARDEQPPVLTGDGRVLAPGMDGFLRAVNAADGAPLWTSKGDRIARIAADSEGKALVTGDRLTVLDADGRSLWSDALPLAGGNGGALAVDATGRAYTGSGPLVVAYSTTVRGDLDLDGAVTVKDAVMVLQVIVGIPPPAGGPQPAQSPEDWDVNGDQVLDVLDAIAILQIVVGVKPGPGR